MRLSNESARGRKKAVSLYSRAPKALQDLNGPDFKARGSPVAVADDIGTHLRKFEVNHTLISDFETPPS